MGWADAPLVDPRQKPLSPLEQEASQRLSFSPEEAAANRAQEGALRGSNLAALEKGIAEAKDPSIRAILEQERMKIIGGEPGDGGTPAWMSAPEVPAGSRGEPPKNLKIGRERFKEDLRETLQQAGWLERNYAAAGTALSNPLLRIRQMMPGGLGQEGRDYVEANRVMAEEGPAGAIAGNIALTVLPVGRAAQVATRGLETAAGIRTAGQTAQALQAARAANLAKTIGINTGVAAGTGAGLAAATTPTLPGESELTAPAYGAAGGLAGDVGARVASRVVQPIVQSPAVQRLLAEGIVPTPGGAMGGIVSRVEQKLTSIPIFGDIINRGRQRAINELNEAAIRRAGGAGVGREAIRDADDAIDQGYRAVLARIQVSPDRQFLQSTQRIRTDPDIALPARVRGEYDDIIQEQIWQRFGNAAVLPGETAKRADSMLGALARRYGASQDADQRALAVALRETQAEFRGMIRRSAPDRETAGALDELNRRYANFLRVERASSQIAAEGGTFSPQQLDRAVRALDPSRSKRQYARGEAMMQDLSDPARAALANVVPNSGTADRAMWGLLAGGAGAGVGLGGGLPGLIAAGVGVPLAYSRAGSRYLLGDLIPGQAALGAGLRSTAPYATVAGETLVPKR